MRRVHARSAGFGGSPPPRGPVHLEDRLEVGDVVGVAIDEPVVALAVHRVDVEVHRHDDGGLRRRRSSTSRARSCRSRARCGAARPPGRAGCGRCRCRGGPDRTSRAPPRRGCCAAMMRSASAVTVNRYIATSSEVCAPSISWVRRAWRPAGPTNVSGATERGERAEQPGPSAASPPGSASGGASSAACGARQAAKASASAMTAKRGGRMGALCAPHPAAESRIRTPRRGGHAPGSSVAGDRRRLPAATGPCPAPCPAPSISPRITGGDIDASGRPNQAGE